MRRSGDRIRVTAQLISAADGYHLWSQRYDRQMADIFDLQDEIATAIAAALQVKLAPQATARRYEPTLPAYDAYLRARHVNVFGRPTLESWERAKALYERAISLDPKFALAHSELAWHFVLLGSFGWRPHAEALPAVRVWAVRALELDASIPQAHAVLALVAAMWDFDWAEAERRFAMAMAREPVPPKVRADYALYLNAIGRPLEGAEQVRRVINEDPLVHEYRTMLFQTLWAGGLDDQAVGELHHILKSDEPYQAGASFYLGLCHASRGEWGEALHHSRKAYEILGRQHEIGAGGIAYSYGRRSGSQRTARESGIARLLRRSACADDLPPDLR